MTDGGSDQTRIDEGGGDSSRTRGGTLAELVGRLESRDVLRSVLTGGVPLAGIEVLGITHDSRRVAPGSVFVAIQGDHHDGHDHVPAAVAAGAVGLVLERAVPTPGVPQVLVAAPRRALAVCAAWFEGDPSHRLGVVGITGTDGKTTTAYLVCSMLEAAGLPTGMLGTIDVLAGGQSLGNPGRATTPEAPELQANLRQMVDAGDRWAVVESTSHGLAQDRVAEVAYDVAVHTNVTHEHLEFHRTPEAYRAAKRRLFVLPLIIKAFRAMVANHKGEVSASVTVAEPLSDEHLSALKSALNTVTGKDVDLQVDVDPAIIGGLVVKLGSRMVDSSLRTKLNSIKTAMKEAR